MKLPKFIPIKDNHNRMAIPTLQGKLAILLLIWATFSHFAFTQCNGSENVCSKKYNEVAFLTTHNAFNSLQDIFYLPNQNFNIATQLEDGVRGLMIDVYGEEGELLVYHAFPNLGTAPFTNYLTDVKLFLDENPNEVVTIILQCASTADAIEAAIVSTELQDYLFAYDEFADDNMSWPTLQTMIDDNKRLVVFTDVDDAGEGQEWYHYMWDYAVETHFSNNSIEEFSCDFNRGAPENDLFILNHFITNAAGVGVESEADSINNNPYFINRVLECQEATGKFPNFVTIDFYDLGDGLAVVETLNNQIISGLGTVANEEHLLKIYPNPTSQTFVIESPAIVAKNIVLLNALGKNLNKQIQMTQLTSSTCRIDCTSLQPGVYFIQIGESIAKVLIN